MILLYVKNKKGEDYKSSTGEQLFRCSILENVLIFVFFGGSFFFFLSF